MIIKSKNIYLPTRVVDGFLEIEDGKIKSIFNDFDGDYIDYGEASIIPGFIDLHVHGYGTGSFTHEGDVDSLKRMAESVLTQGVTSFLPTTGADSIERIIEWSNTVDEFLKENYDKGSEVLGIHYEGPFINKEKKGMQKEEHCLDPSIEVFNKMLGNLDISKVKLMTIAPELDGAEEMCKFCMKNNIQLSIGHSVADFQTIKKMKDYGINGVTHMYSGMTGFHHRELGVAGSALYFDDLYCEFAKQTGLTVLPEALDIAIRIKGLDRITLCSDSVGLAHVKEPFYHYIRQTEFIPDGDYITLKHDDGTVKKIDRFSMEDMDDIEIGYLTSVKNLAKNNNMSLRDIIKIGSENTAKYINVFDRKGSIEVNKDADLVVMSKDLDVLAAYVNGELRYENRNLWLKMF